jgi:uncharacterized cupin superfamily protein
MPDDKPYPHLLRKADIEAGAFDFSHPWNPQARLRGTHLSGLGGLERTGVSIARLAPGRASFAYHMHHREEEWIYIISGRALARIDGEEYVLEAGDFVAFPTPSVAHNLENPFDEDVVYLMGGEHRQVEIADFPELGKRMVRLGDTMEIYELADGKPFPMPE